MPLEVMSAPTRISPAPSRRPDDQGVAELIAEARSAPARSPLRNVWALSGSSLALLWMSFTPLDWRPLGWIALVPLILLIRLRQPTRWMYRSVYLCGLAYTLATLQWMRLGDPTMYPAWFLLAVYVAVYFPLFVALSRVAVHRLALPLTASVPVVWVGLEYLRAHLLTGFSWYYLGHTQYWWPELIQISDLVGAYGVSFVMALSACAMAVLIPATLLTRLKLLPPQTQHPFAGNPGWGKPQIIAVASALGLFALSLGYGYVRRGQADFQPGPRVGLIQGNFTASVKHNPYEAQRIFFMHRTLTGMAVRHQPDVIIWPETMYRAPLLQAPEGSTPEQLAALPPYIPAETWQNRHLVPESLRDRAQEAGAAMIIGLESAEADGEKVSVYNSAAFVRPDVGLAGRYDKIHRVIFGEYIPLKQYFPWLRAFVPVDPRIDAGEKPVVFEYHNWRFAPVICFEDTVPHLVRGIVRATAESAPDGQPVDCLVNLTNDGWFHGSSELDQHLITAAFRAVECRTPMVRAVNTGISGIIDGDGVIVEPEVFIDGDQRTQTSMRDPETGNWRKQLNAAIVHTVPLDNRSSLYVWWGDWFAGGCGAICLFLAFGRFLPARRSKPSAA